MPTPVLVTGATGFIGANFVLQLAQHGHSVIAYDLNPPIPLLEQYWAPCASRITFAQGSVTDAPRLTEIGKQYAPRAILHAAAITAVDPVTEARMAGRMVQVNLMGTVRLLELARQLNIRRMVYISSSGVYGAANPPGTILETTPLPPVSDLYTITKRSSEEICARYHELLNLDVVVGRLNGPYGPMERDTGVRPIMSPIYQLARAALTKRTVRLRAKNRTFDWTYVLDLAEAVRLLLDADTLPHRVYNLSGGQVYPLSDVTHTLQELIPECSFQWVNDGEEADVTLDNMPERSPLDITRLREDVGYESAYPLTQGLTAALPWWRAMVEAGG